MQEIIGWCNLNQGFLTAILSIMTILISVLALMLTYKIGKMPYRKEISITPFLYKDNNDYIMDVLVVNSGIVPILIDSVHITNNADLVIGMDNIGLKPVLLSPNESMEMKIKIFDDEENIAKNELDLNNKIKIIVYEYNGKKYEKHSGFPVG